MSPGGAKQGRGGAATDRKKLLFVLDDANYTSGAQNATAAVIRALLPTFEIDLFSLAAPGERAKTLFAGAGWLQVPTLADALCLTKPATEVLPGRQYSLSQKWLKMRQGLSILLGRQNAFTEKVFLSLLKTPFERYDTVVTVSEASQFRGVVAALDGPRKVQWIHTDYARWRDISRWTRGVTARDGTLYERFDRIVTLSRRCRDDFSALYPHLAEKTVAIRNLVDCAAIRQRAGEPLALTPPEAPLHIVSVGRAEGEKNFDWAIDFSKRLRAEGLRVHWTVVGGGRLLPQLRQRAEAEGVFGELWFAGPLENPLPLVKQADLFVLLSRYEGTPATIDEALCLGVPVLATAVGGVPEQVQDGKTGLLAPPEKEPLYAALRRLCGGEKETLAAFRAQLRGYRAPREESLARLHQLFEEG
ncbi:glycosyltransferase [Ruminococcaceae bacterium OttesenSCG-928-I18]|nr:glycosyltransferase [Ruminococcaceae bacterium OttesenSCG-928-I18]